MRTFATIYLAFMVVSCCVTMWRDGFGSILMFINGAMLTLIYLQCFHDLGPLKKANIDRHKLLQDQAKIIESQSQTLRNQNDQQNKLVALRAQQNEVMKSQKQRIKELEQING